MMRDLPSDKRLAIRWMSVVVALRQGVKHHYARIID